MRPKILRVCVGLTALYLASIFLQLSLQGGAAKRRITEKDLFDFTWIADPQISPGGSQVAFVKISVNQKKDAYETSLWVVPIGGTRQARPLTSGPRDLSPRWSPNGRTIAFTRAGEKDGKPQPPQIYLLPMEGGEARAVTDLAKGAGIPVWCPDGKTIIFTSTTLPEDTNKKDPAEQSQTTPDREPRKAENRRSERESGGAGEKEGEHSSKSENDNSHESDVRVITRAVYRFNGTGYLDSKRHTHLWSVKAPDGAAKITTPRQLTSGSFDESNLSWSPDGSGIYFTSNRVLEPYYEPPDIDLYSVPAAGGEIVKVASIDGTIGDVSFSPDGKRIAFRGTLNTHPVRSYNQPDLFVVDNCPGATPKNLTAEWDFDIGSGLGSDQHAPRGSLPAGTIWSQDGRSLFVVAAEHGRANLKRVDADSGKVEPLTTGDHEVIAYTATPDASKMALLISDPTSISDIFVLDLTERPHSVASAKSGSNGSPENLRRLTRVNEELFSEIEISAPEEFWYTGFDGRKIQAWIQKPPNFDASKKFPLILEIHGGPHAAYGYTFTHEFQWMAAKGYVVLYTNPRGSTSYGQEFGNIIQHHYPGDDYRDLMAGVDEVVKRGYIDTQHMGVTGGSGGGLLTNWVVTQTNRFAAAVSQRSIADWAGFWYTADFTLFTASWFKAPSWEDPGDFVARSPITYIAKVTTPMMFIEGEVDYRTPPADGGEQMFRALKFRRIPAAMVRFPDESHELSRSGKPWHRVERLQHILNWFDKYLQGKPIKIYDVQ